MWRFNYTPDSNALYHYGVKGMKWGIRKESYDSNPRLRSGYTIKKGSTIQNISYKDPREIRSGYSPIYAATTKKDKLNYKGFYSDFLSDFGDSDTNVYANAFTVNKNLKVASQKEAVEEFKNMVRENPKKYAKAFAKAGAGQTILSSLFAPLGMIKKHQTYKKYKEASEEFLDNEGYANFVQLMGTTNKKTGKIREDYYKRLSDKGYGAIFDAYDINTEVADEPIIIINPSDSLSNRKSIVLSQNDINKAMHEYVKMEEDDDKK